MLFFLYHFCINISMFLNEFVSTFFTTEVVFFIRNICSDSMSSDYND